LEVFKIYGELETTRTGNFNEVDLAINQFENDFLLEILGVKYDDFGPDTGHFTFNLDLKKAVIGYFAHPEKQSEYLAQIQEALDKLKIEARTVTLNNVNASDIVSAHIRFFHPPES